VVSAIINLDCVLVICNNCNDEFGGYCSNVVTVMINFGCAVVVSGNYGD
jgi:hypothetical protein